MYITSNENLNVFMDDMMLMHTTGPIIRVDDYYPYGLMFKSSSKENKLTNKFLYNGKEKNIETGLYDYGARQYDPVTGRFTSVDPAADLMRRYSPFAYAFDNPLTFIDPDGMMPDLGEHLVAKTGLFSSQQTSIAYGPGPGEGFNGGKEDNRIEGSDSETSEQPNSTASPDIPKGNINGSEENGKNEKGISKTDLILAGVGTTAFIGEAASKQILSDRTGVTSGKVFPNSPKVYNKGTAAKVNGGAKVLGWSLIAWNVYNTESQFQSGEINNNRRQYNHLNSGVGVLFPLTAIPIAAGDYIGQTYTDEIVNDVTQPGGFFFEVTKWLIESVGLPTSPEETE